MKKILLLIVLVTACTFSQENRLVRQNELSDSLTAVRALIGTGGVALPDSIVFASELTPYASTVVTDSLAEDIANIADSNFVLTSETTNWDKTSSDDLLKADSTLYFTQTDALDKVDENLTGYSAYLTPTDADLLFVQKESDNASAKVELASLPISSATQSALDLKANNGEMQTRLAALESDNAIFKQDIADLQDIIDSLGVRIDAITPSYPFAPTEFLATPISISAVNLTWKGGFRNYDAVIIDSSSNGVNYYELARQVGSDSTYSHTGLASNTLTYYYVSFYDSTLQLGSNYSNIDTATTFSEATPPDETAGNVFVDNTASGINNGSTWENAYETFGDIIWANVDVGDTVFISGGASGQTYSGEIFTLGKSGTLGNEIVITKGYSTGHNGTVTIENTMTSGKRGFRATSKNYWKLEKIFFGQSDTTINSPVYVDLCANFTLDSLIVYSAGKSAGIRIDRDTNFTVQRCSVYTATGAVYRELDGFFINNSTNGVIDGNTIRLNTTIWNSTCHDDGIQGYVNNGMTYKNNTIYLSSPTGGGTTAGYSGIYEESAANGVFKIYNNLIHTGSVTAIGIYFPGNANVDSLFIYSNTIYNTGTQGWKTFGTTGIAKPYIKNNIIYQPNSTNDVAKFSGITDYSGINNNCWKDAGATPTFDGIGTWATWQSNGADANGITVNPEFTTDGSDFTLQAGSPAITAGATLGWIYAVDILGVTRTAGYSMGAYEYVP